MSLRREPRPHPYLFFSAEDLPELKNRAGRPPHDACYHLLLQTADRLLGEPIPEEPAPEDPHLRYRFHAAGRALQSCGQVLAFAFVLSGDPRYAARARDWGLAFAGWTRWSSPADELPAAHALLGTALLYDWLGDFLQPGERQILRTAMVRQLRILHRRWHLSSNSPSPVPPGSPSAWISQTAAGLGSLTLLHEEAEAPTWAAECAELFRDRILPASFGRQGEFLTAAVGWDLYALRHGLLYCAALERCSGFDLCLNPGLRTYPEFLLQSGAADGRSPGAGGGRFPPSPHHLRYLFLRLADVCRIGELYSLATRDGLAVPEGTSLEWFYPYLHRTPYEPERWYTVALSWDAARAECSLAIDRRRWNFAIDDPAPFARIDGVRFCVRSIDFPDGSTGAGFRLRHLGVRVGDDPAAVLLERDAELHIGEGQQRGPTAARLQAPELHLEFPPGAAGMVWFQICKADLIDEAEIRLTCDSQPRTGLRLAAAGPTPVQGADFQAVDEHDRAAPPGSWSGGQIWFDGPWEYLWCPPEPPPERSIPHQSRHFLDAGLVLLRGSQEADPEFRFCGSNGDFALQVDGRLLTGSRAGADAPSSQLAPDGLPAPTAVDNAPLFFRPPSGADDGDTRRSPSSPAPRNGRIESFFTSPAFDAVVCNAVACNAVACNAVAGQSHPDSGGFRRSIAYIKPDYFVLADAFDVATNGRIEWRLRALGDLSIEADRALIQAAETRLELFLLRPEGISFEREGVDRLCARLAAREGELLALLVPGRTGSPSPFRPEAADARGGCGLRLARGGSVDFVLFRRPDQGSLTAEGMRTDAELLFARRGGRSGLSLYGLVGGTGLQVRTELMRASRPVDLCVRQTPMRLSASLQTDGDLELRLVIPGPPRAVRLDGAELAADAYDYVAQGRRLVLELTAGLHQLEVTSK